ncbi:MAG: TolC family protein [Chitinophagaceae bacterium]
MKKLLLILGMLWVKDGPSQLVYTLNELVSIAKERSYETTIAKEKLAVRQFEWKAFKAELSPSLTLFGNLPVYNKEFYGVRQPDGSMRYLPIHQQNSNIGFTVSQPLLFSGGSIAVSSDLKRFDDFGDKFRQYTSTPVYISLHQPLFGFNEWKWRKKIAPLRLENARRIWSQDQEEISLDVVELFYNLMDAQTEEELAATNLKRVNEDLGIEEARISKATTSTEIILRLRGLKVDSERRVLRAVTDRENALYALKQYLQLEEKAIVLNTNLQVPGYVIDEKTAIEYALKSGPLLSTAELSKVEAESEVSRTRKQRFAVNLQASYGLNNTSNTLSDAYQAPRSQQQFSVGFSVPLIDWGRNLSNARAAKAYLSQVNATADQLKRDVTTEIHNLVSWQKMANLELQFSASADSIAQARYDQATLSYRSGMLALTDLAIAQQEKDAAKKMRLNLERRLWELHFRIRQITAFDFATGRELYLKID